MRWAEEEEEDVGRGFGFGVWSSACFLLRVC